MVITPTEVVFTNKCAEKDDEGDYAVVLLNDLGQDNCSLKVTVKGKSPWSFRGVRVADRFSGYLIFYIL